MDTLKELIQGKGIRIMFTEGWDERVIKAASALAKEGLLHPILNGKRHEIEVVAKALHIDIKGIEIMDHMEYQHVKEMVLRMVELRKGRVSAAECEALLLQPNYFTTMCLVMGEVDGLLGGATISTRDTLRAALQLIKTRQGYDIVSSCFLMVRGEERYIMGDCSLNINPNADELVEIALQCAKTANIFAIEPRVGLLSYSTMGSGKGESVDKMVEAVKRLKRLPLRFEVEGELQVDAAVSHKVAQLKAVNSTIAGAINTFIFPSLDAGNIAYKLLARFAGFEAIGPIIQGLDKPLNDLSRGANAQEIYKMAIVTAAQHLMNIDI